MSVCFTTSVSLLKSYQERGGKAPDRSGVTCEEEVFFYIAFKFNRWLLLINRGGFFLTYWGQLVPSLAPFLLFEGGL